MKQATFDFGAAGYSGFDSFLGQHNAELINVLKNGHEQFVYLWGRGDSGLSYLLQACVTYYQGQGENTCYIDASKTVLQEDIRYYDYLAIDHLNDLDSSGQIVLFSVFNRFQNQRQGRLLLAGDMPPAQLRIREDLRTRLGFCLVYEIKPLSDQEKISALVDIAKNRQLMVSEEVFVYLLNHWQRDMGKLTDLLGILDRYSLAVKKPITVALVKKVMEQYVDEKFGDF